MGAGAAGVLVLVVLLLLLVLMLMMLMVLLVMLLVLLLLVVVVVAMVMLMLLFDVDAGGGAAAADVSDFVISFPVVVVVVNAAVIKVFVITNIFLPSQFTTIPIVFKECSNVFLYLIYYYMQFQSKLFIQN